MSSDAFDYDGARQLWKHVVLQAFCDACMEISLIDLSPTMPDDFHPDASRPEERRREFSDFRRQNIWKNRRRGAKKRINEGTATQEDARQWLLGGEKNFVLVCEMAGWCPDYINQKANHLRDREWIAPATLGAQLRGLCK